ncbi:hypothetical protein ANCDUO_06245 [Ancylostoma duodenale]|uniref:Uncharacterized protein n=1 Tax=Ancylostoma duodenale TaxID=51022 RepID=A0A0C2H237_9BILA|nr:hypothetical protein ANCDUO_06245 [Ancylostoma duodenale]
MQARTEEELKEANRKYAKLDIIVKKSCRCDKKDWLMQKGGEPRRPRIVETHKDRSEKPLMTVEEQGERWMQHFREVLNQPDPSETYNFGYEEEPFDDSNVSTGDTSIEETETAARGLRIAKAPGLDKITAELLKSSGRMLAERE